MATLGRRTIGNRINRAARLKGRGSPFGSGEARTRADAARIMRENKAARAARADDRKAAMSAKRVFRTTPRDPIRGFGDRVRSIRSTSTGMPGHRILGE